MSDASEGNSSRQEEKDSEDPQKATAPTTAPTAPTAPTAVPGASSHRYASEPLQFRVRGSTITGASPPKFLSLDEIMRAAHGVQDMALAHEIAVDKDFRLEPFDPPDNSYQKLVKETMHRAFFDVLREQLNSDPPVYKQALVLLDDVKKGLFSILMPRHTRIRTMIEEVLDSDFIRQQAENDALDFQKYASFVVDLMGKLAAPARDEMIQNIAKMEDTVEIFRAILETLEVMKLDLANTLIALMRPHVQAQSVAYEKAKFDDFLKVQEDGLEFTRAWLLRHIDRSELQLPVTEPGAVRNATARALAGAYLELLEWDESNTYPETVLMDAHRFAELSQSVYRLTCVASALLVSPACSAADAASAAAFKRQLKERLYVLMANLEGDAELNKLLPSVAEEVLAGTEELLRKFEQPELTGELKELVRSQLLSLRDPQHRVRQLVRQRVLEFLREVLVCGGGSRPVPVGLSALSAELTGIAGTLLRVVMHNKAVFTDHYLRIVETELAKPLAPTTNAIE